MYIHNRKVARMAALGIIFSLCCLVYILRMGAFELNSDNIGGHKNDGTVARSVVVKAQRGQIYDREGRALVSNRYSYDLTFDYSVMPPENPERNEAILRTLGALKLFDGDAEPDAHSYPLVGSYPDLGYSVAVTDTSSREYKTLIYYFTESGLRSSVISRLRSNGMSRTEAAKAFDAAPLKYISADELVGFMVKEYGLLSTDSTSSERYYTDAAIDKLLLVRYGMVVTGFSRANDYTLVSSVDKDVLISVLEWGIDGVSYTVSSERVYEYPGYASHILGQTGPIYAEDWEYYNALGYNMNATVGISGCELAFEEYLRGSDGVKIVVEDKDGNIVDEYMKAEAHAGQDVYLTIDIDLQIAAEDGLRDNVDYVNANVFGTNSKAGALTAIDPDTGEVLALASYPTFDLSTLGADYNELAADSALPLLNRALQGTYAPGSTFKPCVAIAALSEGTVSATETIACLGVYTYYDSYQPHCWVYNSPTSSIRMHGNINVVHALEVSCNCYFYDVGRRLGIDKLNEYSRVFGLGGSTGIEIYEVTGSLAGPEYRDMYHLIEWQSTDTIAASIGQSDNSFTPLQLGTYISALANRGTRYYVHLLLKVLDFASGEDVYVSTPQVADRIDISEEVILPVIQGMEQVVETNSTVHRFMKDIPVTVAGKTGTAQVGGDEVDNGLFVCMAPSRDPQIVISSVIERCGSGSYAAMAASRVIEKYYEK